MAFGGLAALDVGYTFPAQCMCFAYPDADGAMSSDSDRREEMVACGRTAPCVALSYYACFIVSAVLSGALTRWSWLWSSEASCSVFALLRTFAAPWARLF